MMETAVELEQTDRALILRVDVTQRPGETVLAAHGEIDASVIATFQEALRQAVSIRQGRLLVDLSQVTYMDSGCVYALLDAWQALDREPGSFAVRLGTNPASLAFRAAGLERFVPVEG